MSDKHDERSRDSKHWMRWLILGIVTILAIASITAIAQQSSVKKSAQVLSEQKRSPLELITKIKGEFSRFSADGRVIFTVTDDQTKTYLYDFTGKKLGEFEGEINDISSSGLHLVTSSNGLIRLYELSGKFLAQFTGFLPRFNADGQRLASRRSSSSREIFLYDLSGKSIVRMEGTSYQFSPDGKYLIVMPQFGEFVDKGENSRIYETRSGQLIAEFNGEFQGFSADGKYLVISNPLAYT